LLPGIFKRLVWYIFCLFEVNGLKRSVDPYKPKMRIGRESAYASEGLLALAAKPRGTVLLLRDIAGSRDVPRSFLAKIFQKLARSGIRWSDRCADANPCALHSCWKQARHRIVDELMERTTLADLAKGNNP